MPTQDYTLAYLILKSPHLRLPSRFFSHHSLSHFNLSSPPHQFLSPWHLSLRLSSLLHVRLSRMPPEAKLTPYLEMSPEKPTTAAPPPSPRPDVARSEAVPFRCPVLKSFSPPQSSSSPPADDPYWIRTQRPVRMGRKKQPGDFYPCSLCCLV